MSYASFKYSQLGTRNCRRDVHISLVLSLLALPLGVSAGLYGKAADLRNVSYDFIIVGGGVGGSVLANCLTENPAMKVNDDAFETKVTDDPGWTWDNVQTYFKRNEKWTPPAGGRDTTSQYDPSLHSTTGMTSFSLSGHHQALDAMVFQAGQELGGIFDFKLDYNDGRPLGWVSILIWLYTGWLQAAINGSQRSSAATSYFAPQYINRPNLHVLVGARVSRLLKTGSGCAFRTVEYTQDVVNGPLSTFTASMEVLLAVGVISTPQILLNSGIGDSAYLSSIGITPLVNLPSVGRNLTDQWTTGCLWNVRNDADTFDSAFQDEVVLDTVMDEWNNDETGPLVAFYRPNDTELADLGVPAGVDYAAIGARLLLNGFASPTLPPGKWLTISTSLVSATSRGSVTLDTTGGLDVFRAPHIDPAFYTTEWDIKAMRETVKATKSLVSAPVFQDYVLEALEAYVRGYSGTTAHPVGTASMSPRGAQWRVVDPDLKMKVGVQGVRIVDASVFGFVKKSILIVTNKRGNPKLVIAVRISLERGQPYSCQVVPVAAASHVTDRVLRAQISEPSSTTTAVISTIPREARSLKEQRNSQIPLISRIPSEILAIIFEFLATTDPIKALPSRGYPYLPERSSGDYHLRENVTRVCRKWRMLALGMPSIWGVFYSDCSQQWMNYVIKERLKPTSLISIRTPHKWRSLPCDILALRLDSERFKDLDVAITTRESMTLMHEALRSKNLPALDILRISVEADVTRGTRGCKSFVWRANASRLQALRIKHILLEVRVPSFPALREFSLDLLALFPYNLTTSSMLSAPCRTFGPLHVSVYWHLKAESLSLRISKPLISTSIDLYEYEGVGSPNMQPIWKLLPPPSPHADLWHTVLHKKLLRNDDKFNSILQIPSPSPKFCFELATKFEEVKAEQHVETGIYFSMPSVSTPDIVALTSRRKPRLSPALKRFALDMAEVEEFHFIDLTQLLEVLMPNQHLEGVYPPLGNAATPATKSKSRQLKSNPQQGSKLPSFPIYLPALLRVVVIQQVDLGPSLNVILDYLGQIFLKRKKRGLPMLAMKLGGQIYLNAKQRTLVGDGVSVELSFIDEGDCTYYMNTSLKELPEYLGY
ncbi:FAD/NAD(P)-binding domain-containing protein [Pleurotus eryngii]|uniref:FAD/NAD(P)-binding domain-containing protein n=1 Tax=Pleurotus eryngii TaxID=5323 RepID=A0A9P6DCJ0_PLEER|nr:FAD/NAD(P)-binding domain-containing protein [Pleurotus eryngii]